MLMLMQTSFYESTNEIDCWVNRQLKKKLERIVARRRKELIDIATFNYKACQPKDANFPPGDILKVTEDYPKAIHNHRSLK
jgi:hypothetical protein